MTKKNHQMTCGKRGKNLSHLINSHSLHTGTPLPYIEHIWIFLIAKIRDLIAIQIQTPTARKQKNCVLTAALAYQSFRVQGYSTNLEEIDDAWDLVMAFSH